MNYSHYFKSVIAGIALACMVFLLVVFYQMGAPTETSRWTYEIMQLKSSYAQSLKDPKLIVVGGSNALFGISCETIRRETGVFCVNAATHVGLDINYLLGYARSLAKTGDTVLLSLEYELYKNDGTPTDVLIDYVLSRDPQYLGRLNFFKQVDFIARIEPERLLHGIAVKLKPFKLGSPNYDSKYLNQYGDYTNNAVLETNVEYARTLKASSPLGLNDYRLSGNAQEAIRNFVASCWQNKIKVIATWPNTVWFENYRQPAAQEFLKQIENFYKNIDVNVLGSPENFMYDTLMFYDTIYHLNKQGVQKRTERTVKFLIPYLSVK